MILRNAAEAEMALLSWLGQPAAERLFVREVTAGELEDGLAGYVPAVVELLDGRGAIAVPEPGRALGDDERLAKANWREVRNIWESPLVEQEKKQFASLNLPRKAEDAVIARRVSKLPVARLIHYAMPPGASFAAQLRVAGWWRKLGFALGAHGVAVMLEIAAFGLLGRAALTGRWDAGWFWGWVLVLMLAVPLEAAASWWQGWLAICFGGLFKQRLLAGSLAMDVDRIRHEGVGQALGRVLEAEVLENISMTGGATAVLSLMELAAAVVILALGAAGVWTVTLFAAWLVMIVWGVWRLAAARKEWVWRRNRLTHDLIEKMNGHRTRIAQQPARWWHLGEDAALAGYSRVAERMDRIDAALTAAGPRGWLVLGMAAVGAEFVRGAAPSESIAIATGGVLLGYQAMRRFVFGVGQCAAAWQAWELVREPFAAAAKTEAEKSTRPVAPSGAVLQVRDVSYSYPGQKRQVLSGCQLEIRDGDRVLLEGSSGSGKSTFGNILAGLRRPTGGLILAQGLDFSTVGELGWRRQVGTAPQYHENHILSGPLHFNLLIGRSFPLADRDVRDAEEVCQELGLGPLLERMPAGIMEMVGDTGWQLSQGERSRVYLARAILQGAPLVILDESFAALDPETLEQCLQCVLRRAPSLLVIAHP